MLKGELYTIVVVEDDDDRVLSAGGGRRGEGKGGEPEAMGSKGGEARGSGAGDVEGVDVVPACSCGGMEAGGFLDDIKKGGRVLAVETAAEDVRLWRGQGRRLVRCVPWLSWD